jgi:hypothetical protein
MTGSATSIDAARVELLLNVLIPRQSGEGFRFDVGHHSNLIPATIPK